MKVNVDTFGCRLNQAESETLQRRLLEEGFTLVGDYEKTDVYVVNSCCITKAAAARLRKQVRRVRRENPGAKIIFTGCYANLLGEQTSDKLPEVDVNFPGDEKLKLPAYLRKHYCDFPPDGGKKEGVRFKTRKFYKIQDGCSEFCSYCIVPHVRTNLWSRKKEAVLEDLKRLEADYNEVVLTGVHLGLYGRGLTSEITLFDLLQEIDRLAPNFRVRLSSLEPQDLSEELLDLIATSSNFCNYLYLPIQSGSNDVLARMGRKYRREDLLKIRETCDSYDDSFALNADLMVGFPGETEEDFLQTVNLLKNMRLSRAHVFRYSERPGTEAAQLNDKLHSKVKRERSEQLRGVAADLRKKFARKWNDREVEVVIEGQSKGKWCGYTEHYLPATVEGDCQRGEAVRARVHSAAGAELRADKINYTG